MSGPLSAENLNEYQVTRSFDATGNLCIELPPGGEASAMFVFRFCRWFYQEPFYFLKPVFAVGKLFYHLNLVHLLVARHRPLCSLAHLFNREESTTPYIVSRFEVSEQQGRHYLTVSGTPRGNR